MRKIFLGLIAPVLLLAATAVPAMAAHNEAGGASSASGDNVPTTATDAAGAFAERGNAGSSNADSTH